MSEVALAACGTLRGYSRHRRKAEKPCQACREAKAAYQRQRDAAQPACNYEGCTKPSRARGYCGTHLSRIHRHGRVEPPTVEQRFWSHVLVPHRRHTDGCWLWASVRSTKGYGRFSPRRGMHLLAHRYSFQQIHGEIPPGLELDHLCRNTICVNPWHLEPVTKAENVRRQHASRRIQ